MNKIFDYFPTVEIDEAIFLDNLLKGKTDDEIRRFAAIYNSRRKEPQLILITCLVGFMGFSGIHRFLINQIGMGILYFFTGGLCLIGTIVDLVNHKSLTFEYNQKVAMDLARL